MENIPNSLAHIISPILKFGWNLDILDYANFGLFSKNVKNIKHGFFLEVLWAKWWCKHGYLIYIYIYVYIYITWFLDGNPNAMN